MLLSEFQIGLLGFQLAFQRLHDQGLLLGRADVCAGAAADAVFGIDLHAELETLEFLADSVLGRKARGRALELFLSGQHGADGGVRTDKGALVALDAVVHLPFRDVDSHGPLFACRGAQRA